MREEQYNTIGGSKYVCRPLPGWDGVALFFDLVSMVGEPAVLMISQAFTDDEVGEVDAGKVIAAGAYAFFSKLNSETGTRVMRQLFDHVAFVNDDGARVELGETKDFNLHFQGDTFAALQVFAWAVKINYQSFLGEGRLEGLLALAKAAASKARAAGPSGDPTSHQSSTPYASTPTEART